MSEQTQQNNGNGGQAQHPGMPVPNGKARQVYQAKVKDILNMPTGLDVGEKDIKLYVVTQGPEKGHSTLKLCLFTAGGVAVGALGFWGISTLVGGMGDEPGKKGK